MKSQNEQKFSTKDEDNDSSTRDCAEDRGGGWWYNNCGPSSLNGKYFEENVDPGFGGIRWNKLEPSYSFKSTVMKIKRN